MSPLLPITTHPSRSFHGMRPSKNQIEKKQRAYMKELTMNKEAASEAQLKDLAQREAVQKTMGTAYLPLDSKGAAALKLQDDDEQPGGSRGHGKRKQHGVGKAAAAPAAGGKTPVLGGLGGGLTPLTGDRKVEAMLGIRKPPGGDGKGGSSGKGSMLPPPPKRM